MKRQKSYKAVFRTKIDFRYDDELQEQLLPGGYYHLNGGFDEKVFYDDIANKVVSIINSDLKLELQKYTNVSVNEVEVQAVYEGSIEIIYTITLSFLNLVSNLKDLYDVVYLIRKISELHINKKLNDRFGKHFKVDTYILAPREEDYRRFSERYMMEQGNNREVEHDVFFYYLLVANVILLLIVGVLVFGAVRTVYF